MLTLQFLKDNHGKTIATGITNNPRLHQKDVRWVAKVGDGYHDWAIYYHFADKSEQFVKEQGDKITTESVIRSLVPCEDDAFSMYRL